MEMHSVSSSNLVAAGYEPTKQELTIQFRSGVYTYVGVPQHIYNGLLSSPSKGSYHHKYIKNYPFRHGN